MKTQIQILIAMLLFITSCSTKIGLVKRKYSKGYYVSVTKKQPVNALKNDNSYQQAVKPWLNDQEELGVSNKTAVTYEVAGESNITKQTSALACQPSQNHNIKTNQRHANLPALAQNNEFSDEFRVKTAAPMLNSLNTNSKSKGGGDTNTILLVILCVLWWLNLIAVWLHDGKKITNNFWITLILNLTVIGGIIFAILVVLDIINFA